MKPLATLALTSSLMLAAASAYANEIGGIKLGMSLAQAKTASPVLSNMKTISIYTNKIESGFAGWRGNKEYGYETPGPLDEILVFKGNADAIWLIQRIQRIPESERYSKQVLMDSLLKKFGKESGASHNNEKQWIYAKDGKQYIIQFSHSGVDENPCLTSASEENFSLPEPFYIGRSVPTSFNQNCKATYHVEWSLDANNLVRELRMTVIDSAAMVKYINNKNTNENIQRQQKTQQQMNKGINPNL